MTSQTVLCMYIMCSLGSQYDRENCTQVTTRHAHESLREQMWTQ